MELSKIQTPRNPLKSGGQSATISSPVQGGVQEQPSAGSIFDSVKKKERRDELKKNTIIERLAAASAETQAAVAQATRNVNELQVAVQEIAASAQEASKAANESLKAIQEIEKVAKVSDEKAAELSNSIANLQTLIQDISDEIEEMIRGIELAAQTSLESAENVLQLERQANEIRSTAQAVMEVADQTNLLALNAAIEAARAGKHGRGFAVVADEVRSLAEITNKAAIEIQNIIEEIQKDVNVVAEDIRAFL
ncbi:methyl-accepting chemotaxis sensory transducer [Caldicellulosiruptor obsidiansis OB47]|uniref:Methyl-accepting chemotaxis sensory transducer n=1 Tax=Caldicellulosiruptor obsidiansis (strain ATCC BAA-2073 / JCM 16842 / OB47) TaxID=608506 RepID=D9TIL6_CALOO|nr:methyl-accepting chemotaxis protein [Caldicellulosiruptor obsidiansis]ADL41848.1 methyl-accepting chemotaxis sensory transducer [Caldicellulosiruptor obsidiansis OB47]